MLSRHTSRKRRLLFASILSTIAVSAATASGVHNTALANEAGASNGARSQTPISTMGNWSTWQKDVYGSRHNAAEFQINQRTVGDLKLKWAFVFPNVDNATSSQPAVVGDTLYVGSRDAKFYALDAKTGATKWSFDVTPISGPVDADNPNLLRDGPAVAGDKVIFGDYRGYVYALNRFSGELAWATHVSEHPYAVLTGSPLVHEGRVYIGVSSSEALESGNTGYPCCTFRGQFVALDLDTGDVSWRYYTMPEPQRDGSWSDGTPRYAPSGAPVWNSPAIDPATNTVYFGTGQNYTGNGGDFDSVIALDTRTGELRWKQQMVDADTWTAGCLQPDPKPHCEGLEDGTNLDYDFGASPNIFKVGQRTLVGIGQKSGVYHTFDAKTGEIVWQQQVAIPKPNGGWGGIQWGTSYDGKRLYVASWQGDPGTLFALDPATGKILWSTPNPSDGCSTGGATNYPDNCALAYLSAVTSTPGLVYEGSTDGKMRIYRARDGEILWEYDTVREFTGVNGAIGSGGSISGNGGAVVANGMLYVQSGYYSFYGIPGRVLLAFGL